MQKLTVMHTADWHLGRSIKEYRRQHEFRDVLNQMYAYISEISPDLLLVSGDVFDTSMPPAWAQELYYNFLMRLQYLSSIPQVIITAGNHDSPSLLEAPKELLSMFKIKVIGNISLVDENNVISVHNKNGTLIAIVVAVPYLRDSQLSKASKEGRIDSWQEELQNSMRSYYTNLIKKAQFLRHNQLVPIIVMGHLFLMGGSINEHDGTRVAEVGSLGSFSPENTFNKVDYFALGHLHQSQVVCKNNSWRYSGSLLKFSFSETKHKKSVTVATFHDRNLVNCDLLYLKDPISLIKLTGEFVEQKRSIEELHKLNQSIYIEINVNKNDLIKAKELQQWLYDSNSLVIIIQITRTDNPKNIQFLMNKPKEFISLDHLKPSDIFKKRLIIEKLDSVKETTLLKLFSYIEHKVLENKE